MLRNIHLSSKHGITSLICLCNIRLQWGNVSGNPRAEHHTKMVSDLERRSDYMGSDQRSHAMSEAHVHSKKAINGSSSEVHWHLEDVHSTTPAPTNLADLWVRSGKGQENNMDPWWTVQNLKPYTSKLQTGWAEICSCTLCSDSRTGGMLSNIWPNDASNVAWAKWFI